MAGLGVSYSKGEIDMDPQRVYGHQRFFDKGQAQAYREGLVAGANALMQGHGSDPWEVCMEEDSLGKPHPEWHVYLRMGRYGDNGEIVFT